MKRAPTSDWSQDSSPSCFIRANSFHAPSPKQFDGRYPRSGPDGSLDSIRTCRSYSTTFRSRCKIVSLKAFSAPPGAGSCADALTRSRSWRAIRSKEPKRPATERFYRSGQGMAPFLSARITSQLKLFNNVPELSSHFESSVPGLFFVGPAAVDSFGPVLRFACGAGFTASRLSNYLARTSRLTKRWTARAPLQCAHFPL